MKKCNYEVITKPIENFPRYTVDKSGNIFDTYKKKYLTGYIHKKYVRVTLQNDNKKWKLVHKHRLLAKAFIPNPLNLAHVGFLDKDVSNISLDNLYWNPCNKTKLTQQVKKENTSIKTIIQTTKEGVFVKEWKTALELAKHFNVSKQAIYRSLSFKRKDGKPSIIKGYILEWKYEN